MRIVLHVGTAKTGTTSLQTGLLARRRRLARRGVLYPRPPAGFVNHNLLAVAFAPESDIPREFLSLAGGDPDEIRTLAVRYQDRFEREVASSGADVVVVSGEYFFGMAEPGVHNLAQMTARLSNDVAVACYLRDPASYYVSMMQQQVKASHVLQPPCRFQWRARPCLSRYEAIFAGPVTARSAERDSLLGGDVGQDFARTYLPDGLGSPTHPTTRNRSMSAEAMCILQALRRHAFADEDGHFAPESNRILAVLDELAGDHVPRTPPALRPAIHRAFIARHRPDLDYVSDRFGVSFPELRSPSDEDPSDVPPGWDSSDLPTILDVDLDSVDRLTHLALRRLAGDALSSDHARPRAVVGALRHRVRRLLDR